MKKKIIIFTVVFAVLAAIPFVPFIYCNYDDGGTRQYIALTYTVVKWNRAVAMEDQESGEGWVETYKGTSVYWYPDNRKSIGELWDMEQQQH